MTVIDVVADENTVALRLGWSGIDEHGRSITRETIDLLHFKDDRLTEHSGATLSRRVGER